jgi:hypothetical protein
MTRDIKFPDSPVGSFRVNPGRLPRNGSLAEAEERPARVLMARAGRPGFGRDAKSERHGFRPVRLRDILEKSGIC